jgi:SNF2 family DNA or RNA helicase
MDTNIYTRVDKFKSYLDYAKFDHKSYQYDGVRWILNNELRDFNSLKNGLNVRGGFIADEMGLGKTIMMIGTMLCNYLPRTLIVLPPALIDQWSVQIYRTTGHKPIIFYGDNKKKLSVEKLNAAPIVITSYGAITLTKKQINDFKKNNENNKENNELPLLHRVEWNRIIFDEAHHLRNHKTTRYISAKMLKAKIRWLVSGTPVQNRKKDFYSLCSMVGMPASFYTDSNNLLLLARSFILKRTKKSVGIQMPEVVLDKNMVRWQNPKEMLLSEELHSALGFSRVSIKKYSDNGNNGNIVNSFRDKGVLAILLRARQSCIYPKLMVKYLKKLFIDGILSDYSVYKEAIDSSSKLDSVVAKILQRKDNGCGKLIFCHFREEIDEIASRLRNGGMLKVATFDGRTANSKRRAILNNNNEALILQIQTGCEGLNLQENYSEIYFVSANWNPAIEAQAIARCHRIGQNKQVYVERFEMCDFGSVEVEDSAVNVQTVNVDNYIGSIQENKRLIANECIAE